MKKYKNQAFFTLMKYIKLYLILLFYNYFIIIYININIVFFITVYPKKPVWDIWLMFDKNKIYIFNFY